MPTRPVAVDDRTQVRGQRGGGNVAVSAKRSHDPFQYAPGQFPVGPVHELNPRSSPPSASNGYWRLRLAVGAAIAGCFLFAVLSDFGKRAAVVAPLWPKVDQFAGQVGLGIDQVSLVGHHHTPEQDVFDALRLDEQRSFLSFDSAGALARLQKLAWVKSASIVRVLPGQLDVKIVERTAFALWARGDDLALIDVDGRFLSGTEKRFAPKLPLISGEGAADEVGPLMRLVASSKLVSTRLMEARRMSSRRWTLLLTDGVVVHLPAQGAASALALIGGHTRLRNFISRPDTIVDLRVAGRIFVRAKSGKVLLTTPAGRTTRDGRG